MTTFFNPVIPLKEKEISHHPWERHIKDIYSSSYKYAHNSVTNPVYPRIKEKRPDAHRVKFTVIGNRVIKDFNHSVSLVRGLHKYRWKRFGAPVIKAVTSVEWPKVWNDLKLKYGGLAYCLKSQLAVLIDDKFLGGYPELKELIESKYVYHITLDYYKEGINQFARYITSLGVEQQVQGSGIPISLYQSLTGSYAALYSDIVPLTCENFLRLCKTKKGGYSGTPVHRIVKDCWIQCGGFGLKSTSLECENFIVPHDRRGVLCMANDGRHVNCSTQFFLLLQPAPWMAHKYVAFGQLIDGEETLKQIETVQTWYEAPTTPIIIFEAGILNMDCHGITINKETNAYIQRHIEDLVTLGKIFYEELLEKVYLEIDFKKIQTLHGQGEEEAFGEEGIKNIHATKRFMRKKEDLEQQFVKSEKEVRGTSIVSQRSENNEFDVDVYEYELDEEYHAVPANPATHVSSLGKPDEKQFYLALTDVPYPGEIDSTYDLKKMLKGNYCLEGDLDTKAPKKKAVAQTMAPSDVFDFDDQFEEVSSEESSDSDDDIELKKYLKTNADRISFAGPGGIIRNIARHALAKLNLFEGTRKSELITDEELRKFRLASMDYRKQREKKISISLPSDKTTHSKIRRRQTGFVRPEDLERIRIYHKSPSEIEEEEEDDDDNIEHDRKVRIALSATETAENHKPLRRPTVFARPADAPNPNEEPVRPSVLARLYEEVTYDDETGPTLKDYKPAAETHLKNLIFLTSSPRSRIKSTEHDQEKYNRVSITIEDDSLDQFLNVQHGKRVVGKISSDYVKAIDQIEHMPEKSLRSVEYAKSRPTISVSAYQKKNQKYQNQLKAASKLQVASTETNEKSYGLRLPGDTPLYSLASLSST